MTNIYIYIYIYNVSVICCSNNTVQCKEYDYVVTYGRNMHSHTYKNEKENKHKEEKKLVPVRIAGTNVCHVSAGHRDRH